MVFPWGGERGRGARARAAHLLWPLPRRAAPRQTDFQQLSVLPFTAPSSALLLIKLVNAFKSASPTRSRSGGTGPAHAQTPRTWPMGDAAVGAARVHEVFHF